MAFGLNMAGLAPLVPDIEAGLGFSHASMGTVLGAWQFIYIFAAIPCGLVLDRMGTHKALFWGALLIGASGIARGFAQEYLHLLAAVALFGLGGPLISAGAPKVVSENFTGAERGLAMGIYITGPGVGVMVSLLFTQPMLMPLLGGRWGLVLILWGFAALAAGLFWLLVGRGVARPAGPITPSAPLWNEISAVLSLSPVRLILLMSIGVFSINHAMSNWLVELLHNFGAGLKQASLLALVPAAVGIVSALTLPRLATGSRRFGILIALFSCSLFGSLLFLIGGMGSSLYLALILMGIAGGSMMTVLILTLVEVPGVGERRAGTAGGFFFSAAEIGGVGGPVAIGVLYGGSGGFSSALALLALVALLLIGAVVPLRRLLAGSGKVQ
ncbi:MAG: MFS transporter [Acidiferrobacteraceae bacterium]|jgi:cyanate permease|nr:MFS transporter [Acidiferrobacteraceae bacterium]MBT3639745.1 MFS transporter [Acidiferrobacteraceae bacterium]MBT3770408.1 MFS transporter [Acidiferrobacteraceae bacterium]MBT4396084.1 MFS transporter [Acidiferrobacteraceae bacterium]MBT4404066.1 MFS transporter [Acidiferrobacteraceae bacterium]